MTLSRRYSLFSPNGGTLVVLAHADAQNLCAAGACSLSKPWWLTSSLLSDKGRPLQWPDASEILFVCHFLDCHKGNRNSSVGKVSDCRSKGSSSTLALHSRLWAPPLFSREHIVLTICLVVVFICRECFSLSAFPWFIFAYTGK